MFLLAYGDGDSFTHDGRAHKPVRVVAYPNMTLGLLTALLQLHHLSPAHMLFIM